MAIFEKYKSWLGSKTNPGRAIDEEQARIDAEADARAEETVAAEQHHEQEGAGGGAPQRERVTGGGRRL